MKKFHRSRRRRPNINEAEKFLRRGIGHGMRDEDYVTTAERKFRISKLVKDVELKLKEHIPRSRNLELVILKCHILLEYILNQFIDLMAATEGVVESERFSFKQKESIAHMLGFPPDPIFFPTLDLINNIRNTVAHELEIDLNKVDRLIRLNTDTDNFNENMDNGQRVTAIKNITRYLCCQVIGVILAYHDLAFKDDENPKLKNLQ